MPSVFYTPGARLPTLLQAVEAASPPLFFTTEFCGLHFTPQVWHYEHPWAVQLSAARWLADGANTTNVVYF